MLGHVEPLWKPFDFDICGVDIITGEDFDDIVRKMSAEPQHPSAPYIAVVFQEKLDEPAIFGWTYESEPYHDGWSDRPLIIMGMKNLRWIPKPLRTRFIAWVVRHELGHAFGLKHHFNPFCVMSKPNISFGRFCRRCMRTAQAPIVSPKVTHGPVV